MDERTEVLDTDTMKFGLLMESAQAHQKLADSHLEKLKMHTQDLDGVVRDEIRRTLLEELQSVTAECERAARALREVKRAAHLRGILWNVGLAVLCTVTPAAGAHWLLPSAATLAAARAQQAVLAQNIARLGEQGGKVQWRRCGEAGRLCVRIDRGAPVYGDKADYYVMKGY